MTWSKEQEWARPFSRAHNRRDYSPGNRNRLGCIWGGNSNGLKFLTGRQNFVDRNLENEGGKSVDLLLLLLVE